MAQRGGLPSYNISLKRTREKTFSVLHLTWRLRHIHYHKVLFLKSPNGAENVEHMNCMLVVEHMNCMLLLYKKDWK